MSYYSDRRNPAVAEARWLAESAAAVRDADIRAFGAARSERNSARGDWDKAAELGAAMGFPKDTLIAVLEKNEVGADTAMNVAFSYDRAEAAAFIQDDLAEIMLHWTGTEDESKFVYAFVQTYVDAKPVDCAWDPFKA